MLTTGPVGAVVGGGGGAVLGGTVAGAVATVVAGATVVLGAGAVEAVAIAIDESVVGGTATVLVDTVGGTDVCGAALEAGDDVAASTRASNASTIEGDGVGGMTTGNDVGESAVGCVAGTTGMESTKTGSESCPRHMTQNASAMTPITINQNDVGNRGNDQRDRLVSELRTLGGAGAAGTG